MRIPFLSSERRSADADRRSFVPFTAMLVGIVLVTTLGPTVVDGLSNQLDQPQVESLDAPTQPRNTAGIDETTDATVTTADVGATTDAPTTTAAEPADASTTSAPTVPTTSAPTAPSATDAEPEAATPLRTIQLVPALRDVIVEIDGREYASDANGVIRIGAVDPGAEFGFVGVRAQPSLRNVAFGRWADGSPDAVRSLDQIDGPTTRIGLVLSHRVTVSTRDDVPDGSEIAFESRAGTMRLEVGRSAWVPAARAVDGPDGLVTQDLTYDSEALVVDDDTTPIGAQEFQATPEALWIVTAGR